MSLPLLPAPATVPEPTDDPSQRDDHEHGQPDARAQRTRGAERQRHIASAEECLAALSALPALVALGLLSPSKANTIRSSYAAILQHYQRQQSPADRGGVADEGLVEMLTRHPEYANLLEPLLSAELVATILARAGEDSHGYA